MLRLFILEIVSAVPFYMLLFNVLGFLLTSIFTLFFGLCALYLAGKAKYKFLKGVIVVFFMAISIVADAGVSGVLLIYMFGTIESRKKALIYGLIAMNGLDVALALLFGQAINIELITSIIGTFLTYPLLIKYNGQRGWSIKYFFYIFYPLHIIVLLALQQLCECDNNIERYKLLAKIGVDEYMINWSLLLKIGIYFMVPLSLAIIYSIIGIKLASQIVIMFGGSGIIGNVIFIAVMLVIIYGGYFMSTYLGTKKIIKQYV